MHTVQLTDHRRMRLPLISDKANKTDTGIKILRRCRAGDVPSIIIIVFRFIEIRLWQLGGPGGLLGVGLNCFNVCQAGGQGPRFCCD
jgi:hypothetical protein